MQGDRPGICTYHNDISSTAAGGGQHDESGQDCHCDECLAATRAPPKRLRGDRTTWRYLMCNLRSVCDGRESYARDHVMLRATEKIELRENGILENI